MSCLIADFLLSGPALRMCIVMLMLAALLPDGMSQTTVVEWHFPNNPDDAIADGGSPDNLGKIITTQGGTGTLVFNQDGIATRCAAADNWDNGANVKFWQIEFSTSGYTRLTAESQMLSFSPGDFGPKDWTVQYRIGESGHWTAFYQFEISPGNQWYAMPATDLPRECSNQPSVYIRWMMTSNVPTQGSGAVDHDAFSRMDNIVVKSSCSLSVSALPGSQTVCPGSLITPIVLTTPGNNPSTTYTWVRSNTVNLTGIPASGSSNPIEGSLNSTTPQLPQSTLFTITATDNGCSAVTTASVTVLDNEPPVFNSIPNPVQWCVQDIIAAFWDLNGDITPIRPDWYTFYAGGTNFDLNPAIFSDNCTSSSNLTLHWTITLAGGAVISGVGQISQYASNIIFPLGNSTVTYWLEDQSGNLTPVANRPVVLVAVLPRPSITRNF
jgi:hypothetical protein